MNPMLRQGKQDGKGMWGMEEGGRTKGIKERKEQTQGVGGTNGGPMCSSYKGPRPCLPPAPCPLLPSPKSRRTWKRSISHYPTGGSWAPSCPSRGVGRSCNWAACSVTSGVWAWDGDGSLPDQLWHHGWWTPSLSLCLLFYTMEILWSGYLAGSLGSWEIMSVESI